MGRLPAHAVQWPIKVPHGRTGASPQLGRLSCPSYRLEPVEGTLNSILAALSPFDHAQGKLCRTGLQKMHFFATKTLSHEEMEDS